MTSETNICNRALSAMGTRSTIASLTEQSNEAEQCNIIYSATRDEVLSMAPWNFCQKTATLAVLKAAPGTPENPTASSSTWTTAFPPPPWIYSYAYPSDCILARAIIPQFTTGWAGTVPIFPEMPTGVVPYLMAPAVAVRFTVATDVDTASGQSINVILTNQYQAILRYNERVTNPDRWSPMFAEALVQALAAKLALQLSGAVNLSNSLFTKANAIITQARSNDGNEGLTVIDTMPDWIRARGIEGSVDGNGGWQSAFSPLYLVI